MSQPVTAPRFGRWAGPLIAIGIIGASLIPFHPAIASRLGDISLHAPDWSLWARVPLTVHLHVYAALTALVIGTIILFRPKGRGLHKVLGWSWVVAMGTTAITSLFITGLNGSYWSLIHLLSGWTIIALPMAIYAIRNRKVEIHRRAMTGMFVGGLIIAGAFSFVPGRLMFETFFG
ncbi:MAG: DUF2306 domain-containing protein [Hyphomonadaceae bacterium]